MDCPSLILMSLLDMLICRGNSVNFDFTYIPPFHGILASLARSTI